MANPRFAQFADRVLAVLRVCERDLLATLAGAP